jgi:hypothetical protein
VAVAVVVKTVREHQGAQAVEPVLVLIMQFKPQVRATHHPQVPHRAIPEQSVLVTAVVVEVVLVVQDLQVWAAAAQDPAATVAQVIPGWMGLSTVQVAGEDLPQDRVASGVVPPHRAQVPEAAAVMLW